VAFLVAQHRRTTDEARTLSRAVEQSPASIVITNRAGDITYVNPKFTEVTGYSFQEVEGKNARILKSGEMPRGEYQRLWETISSGGEWRGTFHNRKKNGELFWEAAYIATVLSDAGQITHFLAVKEDITELKRAADALRLSERRHRRFVERNAAGVLCNLPDGQILECNQALARMLGYASPEELKSRRTTDLYFNPEDRRLMLDHFQQNQSLADYELCFKRKDGRPVWVLVNISLAQGEDGEPDCLEGTIIDITERKQTGQLLEFIAQEGWTGRQEVFFARLVEHIGRILAVDYAFVGRLKDPHTVQTTGLYAKGEIVPDIEYSTRGSPCQNVIGKTLCHHGEDLQKLFPDDPLLAQMGAQSYLGVPMLDSSDKPVGLMAVLDTKPMPDARLATALLQIASVRAAGELERQAAAATLQESENRFRQLVETSPNAIFIECDGQFAFVNSAGLKLFGATHPDQILHRPVLDFVHPKDREKVAARAARVRDQQQPVPLLEEQYLRLDGAVMDVEVTAMPFTFHHRRAAQVVVRDITETKKLESQILRLQRMESLGTLAGGIAHDLNNVLTPLMFSVEMLRDKVTDAEGHKVLSSFRANVQRGASLVHQLLTFGRGVEGERVRVQPARLVLEIAHIIQETFPKSIVFDYYSQPGLWAVTGDATQLHQVLLNLSVNARDAMPNGGKLSIELENIALDENSARGNLEARPGPYVLIKVADTGTGIPEAIRDRVFEPFFTTKKPGLGTGLGLSSTLGIVKSHGGFITCYSQVGKGATFKICLPATITPADAEKVTAQRTQLPRGHGELVLVVDDEEAIRNVVRDILERFGYRVLLAVNGAEALSLYALHQQEVAVVLTDMAMPVMDGPAAIAALAAMNPEVRIIASSGLPVALGATVRQFIPKPYTADAILRSLHDVLH